MKVLLCMLFLHLIDDYKLQGILANLKQEDWWIDNAPEKMYRKDYIVALFEHGFMNSFMIHIPIYLWLCQNFIVLTVTMIISTAFHALVDNMKANLKFINLIQDQLLHIAYIFFMWMFYFFIGGFNV